MSRLPCCPTDRPECSLGLLLEGCLTHPIRPPLVWAEVSGHAGDWKDIFFPHVVSQPCSSMRAAALSLCWPLWMHEADGCAPCCDLLVTVEQVLAFLQSLDSSIEDKYFVPSEIQFSVKTVFIKYFHAASGKY